MGNDPNEDYATDPFGWRGSKPDPLINYPAQGQGHAATCLWRSLDVDPVSCADTIVEDAGRGSTLTGNWTSDPGGNGYRMYYRNNTTDNTVQASWLTTATVPGMYKVYAFIPALHATTHQAAYKIWTTTGWQTSIVNQQNYTDTWVLLGTYQLPSNLGYVTLSANTGEAAGTTEIAADAIKFRSYLDYLPLVLKQPTPTPTPPPTAQCGQNALLNPGFESGLPGTPWQQYSSGGLPLISTYRSHTGLWGAWLGGYNNAWDEIYQGFTIPAGANTAIGTFWWYMSTSDSTTVSHDYLTLQRRFVLLRRFGHYYDVLKIRRNG